MNLLLSIFKTGVHRSWLDRRLRNVVVGFTWLACCNACLTAQEHRSVVFERVELSESQWTNGFWAERQEVVRNASIPQMWKIMVDDEHSQFLTNFLVAAGEREGKHRGPSWNDGDFYKWIEAACSSLAVSKDSKLEEQVDRAIAAIGRAQREDGYIHTPVQIRRRQGDETAIPFSEPLQFELYNFGHLMTAACVHHQATGRDSLLKIAIAGADFLVRTFQGPDAPLGRSAICPAHYMGLIELGRLVKKPQYIELAQKLIERRDQVVDGTDDNQDRVPFRKQTQAVGHAVRANYLYAGVADLVAETGDTELLETLKTIWNDVAASKLYITGACGALYDGASPDGSASQKIISRVHQAYGRPYQLPNSTAHNESCATIGNILWNWRMLQLTGDAKYADVLELGLYNGLLATVSLDGSSYFYTNTLRQLDHMPTELRWSRIRKPFISCYCCPPNILRTIAQTQQYAYGKSKDGIWVHLYGSSQLRTTDERGATIELLQQTEYPWNGRVQLNVVNSPNRKWTLRLRIPQWAKNCSLKVNGVNATIAIQSGSYASIEREWNAGDRIELEMPMPVRLIESHPLVEETRNQVAIHRGPLVYCLESKDLPEKSRLLNCMFPSDAEMTISSLAGLPGVLALKTQLTYRPIDTWGKELYRERDHTPNETVSAQLVPYFAWGNRGDSEMSVWLPVR